MKEKLKACLRGVTLRQLRALEATLREGTISGAARALNVTPPAVSLQIRLLEEGAGMPLTERTGQGLRPTDAGRLLLDAAHRVEAALSECAQGLASLHDSGGGRVAIGVVSTAKYFAPLALAAFAKAHPKVEVRLSVGNRGETIAALAGFDVDFALMGRPPDEVKIDSAVIGDHPHIIIGPPDHPMAGRRGIEVAELTDQTFLVREEGSGTRGLMQRLFAEVGVSPRIGMEIGSNETIKQAVMAGLGIALISAHTVAAELRDGRLVALDVSGLPLLRQWFVVKHRDRRLLPAARALWDFLAAEGADYFPAKVAANTVTLVRAAP